MVSPVYHVYTTIYNQYIWYATNSPWQVAATTSTTDNTNTTLGGDNEEEEEEGGGACNEGDEDDDDTSMHTDDVFNNDNDTRHNNDNQYDDNDDIEDPDAPTPQAPTQAPADVVVSSPTYMGVDVTHPHPQPPPAPNHAAPPVTQTRVTQTHVGNDNVPQGSTIMHDSMHVPPLYTFLYAQPCPHQPPPPPPPAAYASTHTPQHTPHAPHVNAHAVYAHAVSAHAVSAMQACCDVAEVASVCDVLCTLRDAVVGVGGLIRPLVLQVGGDCVCMYASNAFVCTHTTSIQTYAHAPPTISPP